MHPALAATLLVVASYEEPTASLLMSMNAAALCPTSALRSWSCSRCNASLFPAPEADIALITADKIGVMTNLVAIVGVVHSHRLVAVVFRGTVADSIADWIIDAEFWQEPFVPASGFAGAKVHHGFLAAWRTVKANVSAALQRQLRRPDAAGYRLVVTGHSLGGGLSALFTSELLAGALLPGVAVPSPPLLYTMGEPRVGNPPYAAALARAALAAGAEAYRLVNDADPVPHLAPLGLPGDASYRHGPREVWLRPAASTNATLCGGSGEDPRCSDSLTAADLRPAHHTSYLGYDAGLCVS